MVYHSNSSHILSWHFPFFLLSWWRKLVLTLYSNLPKLSISPLLISSHDPSLLTNRKEKLNPSLPLFGSMHAHPLLSKPCRSILYSCKFCIQPFVQSFLKLSFSQLDFKRNTVWCGPACSLNHQDLLTRLDGVETFNLTNMFFLVIYT